jgi:hypothetical protein
MINDEARDSQTFISPLVFVAIIALVGSAVACKIPFIQPPATPTPTSIPTLPPTPTAPPPTATPTLLPSATPVLTPTLPAPAEAEEGAVDVIVVARAEGAGAFAIAALTNVSLQAGRQYVLQVTSPAGSVSFHGTYSASAMGGNGLPGIQVELLDGTTPATYPIEPPAAAPDNWVYSVSVQNRGSGGIVVTILDVTEGP